MVTGIQFHTTPVAPKRHNPAPQMQAFLKPGGLLFGASAKLRDYKDLGGHGTTFDGVVVLDGKRTPFGEYAGSLKKLNETDLAVAAAKGLVEATGINPDKIRDSIWGNVIQSSKEAAFLSKNVLLRVGAPIGTVATNVNKLCGSGLKAIDMAAKEIAALEDTSEDFVVLAGGTESMTNSPFASFKFMQKFMEAAGRAEAKAKTPGVGPALAFIQFQRDVNSMANAFKQDLKSLAKQKGPVSYMEFMNTLREGLSHALIGDAMIDTAENLRERFNMKPQELDQYSLESQHWAAKAIAHKKLDDEIVPVKDEKGNVILAQDEGVRGTKVKLDSLAKLRARQGTKSKIHLHPEKAVHTAANASRIVDGAAAVLLTNEETAERLGKKPLGKILSTGEVGVNPHIMGYGAAQAGKVALKASGLDFSDIDLFEVNEAFAGVALAAIKDWSKVYGVDEQELRGKTNINGGAIAIGHPLGATGSRLVVTMLKELQRQNLRYGMVTACIGGGQGIAAVVENPNAPVKPKKAQ